MIGVYNHLLRKVFRFQYHSQKVVGSLGNTFTKYHGHPSMYFRAPVIPNLMGFSKKTPFILHHRYPLPRSVVRSVATKWTPTSYI